MPKYLILLLCALAASHCGNPTQDTTAEIRVESGTDTDTVAPTPSGMAAAPTATEDAYDELLGYYVGYFRRDEDKDTADEDKGLHVDEGFYWSRQNKINISLDRITKDSVIGHSVVAGNDRPFSGTIEAVPNQEGYFHITVREPGDDRYDGSFDFTVNGAELSGTWEAFGNIDIRHRVYDLEKKTYAYDPGIMLDYSQRYIDWNDKVSTENSWEDGDEMVTWMEDEFSTATEKIYEINASTERLDQATVENLHRGDLTIIRNTIYARHGYSFKHRPLRIFFDAQDWYIPVHADIRAEFTELEKENIRLLLRYEKNATTYYDSFGRG